LRVCTISDRRRTISSTRAAPTQNAFGKLDSEAAALSNMHRQTNSSRSFLELLASLLSALATNMHSTFRNVPFGLGKMVDDQSAVHSHIAPPLLRRHGARLRRTKKRAVTVRA